MKKYTYRILFILMIGIIIISCTDHRLPPTQRFRLKTMERNDYVGDVEFTYNQKGQLSSYTCKNGYKADFFYDDQNRYSRCETIYNIKNPEAGNLYQYQYDSNYFFMDIYNRKGDQIIRSYENRVYIYDDQKRILNCSVFENFGVDTVRKYVYEYAGYNIKSMMLTYLSSPTNYHYEYDDHINPLGGSQVNGTLVDFSGSRNNLVSVRSGFPGGETKLILEYAYEYNDIGLPVKVSNKYGPERFHYIYETY